MSAKTVTIGSLERPLVTLALVLSGCRTPPAIATAPAASDAPRALAASAAPEWSGGGPSAPSVESQPPLAEAEAQLLRISRVSLATGEERDHFLYLPKGYRADSGQRWPVMLFLHGNGERGDAKRDLDYLLKNGPLYEVWIQKRDLPFIILAPQLPMYGMDAKAAYLKSRSRSEIPQRLEHGVPERIAEFATSSPMTGAVSEDLGPRQTPYGPPMGWPELEAELIHMLDDVLATRQGDPSRQYLTGLSYGGFGTWYIASKHPERFAAIVPVVGYGHPDLMPRIAAARLPIWCFAGGRDKVVPVKYFYPGLNRLEALGHHDFRFTVEEDMGHDVWARVYAGVDVYDWMLSHQKVGLSGRAVAP